MSKEAAKTKVGVKPLVMTAMMAAVLCILGPLSIPIGPVPLSLTLVGVYLCAYTLGSRRGTLAVFLYVLLGAVGLPVFSGFAGGPAKLFGPTGGYIVGFILTAFICGYFIEMSERLHSNIKVASLALQLVGMLIGLAACYALGTIWFSIQAHVTIAEALGTCVIPFVAFDLIKIALGMALGLTIKRALTAANLI